MCVARNLFLSLTGHPFINLYVLGFGLGTECKVKKTHYLPLEVQGRLTTLSSTIREVYIKHYGINGG